MFSKDELEKHLGHLNELLRNQNVQGHVEHRESVDPNLNGFLFFNPGSHGFLGTTVKEAEEAVLTIIECVKAVEDSNKKPSSLTARIMKFLKT